MNSTQDFSQFNKFIILSLFAHIVLVAVLSFDLSFTRTNDLVIKNSIRVDIVGLPDKVKEKPAPKVEKKESPKVNLQPKKSKTKEIKAIKNKQADALAKLQQAKALQALKQKVKENEIKEEPKEEAQYVGNIITSGNSLDGLNKIAMNEYYEDVKLHIQQYWTLPQWLSELDLKAQAQVLVDERGVVISRSIYTSSENQTFDDFVLSTIDQASPLPQPPTRLAGALKNRGFVLNFPD